MTLELPRSLNALLSNGRLPVGPIDMVATSPKAAAFDLCNLAKNTESGHHVHLVNAYTLSLARKPGELRAALSGDAINLPDGKPVAMAGRLLHKMKGFDQVRGPQLFLDVFDLGRANHLKHFLLGSTPEVLAKLREALETKFPGIEIVGFESPPFEELTREELSAQDDRIAATKPDIVWVGLGTPKQDFEVARLARLLPVVSVGIGAAFDFTAGTSRSAPSWMISAGLEWLFRLGCEPRRLWRRYLIGNLLFIQTVLAGVRHASTRG